MRDGNCCRAQVDRYAMREASDRETVIKQALVVGEKPKSQTVVMALAPADNDAERIGC